MILCSDSRKKADDLLCFSNSEYFMGYEPGSLIIQAIETQQIRENSYRHEVTLYCGERYKHMISGFIDFNNLQNLI